MAETAENETCNAPSAGEKARRAAAQVKRGIKDASTVVADEPGEGATRVAGGTIDAAIRATEMTSMAASQVAVGIKNAATWSTEKTRIGATHVAEGAKDAATWSAEKARGGVEQVADGARDASIWVWGKVRAEASFQKMQEVIRDPTPFWETYGHLSRFSRYLDWGNLDPTKYLYAGTRGEPRDLAGAKRVWETIPEQIRAAGPEATANALEGMDWSHVKAYSQGGSHSASNGIFENASLNRARGSDRMTATELEAAQRVLNGNALRATLLETSRCALKGASVAAAMAAVVAVLEYGLMYQRGEITEGEMYRAIGRSVVTAGISGAAVSGLLAAMSVAFPPLIPVVAFLCVPSMVIGFAVLGSRLAVLRGGWHQVYLSEQPLKPLALQYWLAEQVTATGSYVGRLARRHLVEEKPEGRRRRTAQL